MKNIGGIMSPQNDKWGYHEVVHLSSVIAILWENEILEHGAVEENEKLKEKASKIFKLIAEFYQEASQANFEKYPDID